MTRQFFDQVDDELRGLLGPSMRDYQSLRTSRLIKIWYGEPAIHYEALWVAPWWAPGRKAVLEIGLHLESRTADGNDEILGRLNERARAWRRRLPKAEAGSALGPRAADWRRLSEILDGGETEDPDFASEVAERLALYARTLEPVLRRE
jgi:hypothetical protein